MLNNIDLLSIVFSGLRFVFHFSLSLSCMYRCFDIDIWFSCEGPLLATAFNSHGTHFLRISTPTSRRPGWLPVATAPESQWDANLHIGWGHVGNMVLHVFDQFCRRWKSNGRLNHTRI